MYLAYGIEGIHCEALYSILSYLKHNSENLAQITIYTDDKDFFKSFLKDQPINYETLSEEQITSWRGDINFVHRLKLESIIDFAKKNNGNMLFLDSDTVIKSDLSFVFNRIEKGDLVLQFNEGKIKDNNPKTYKFVKRNHFKLTNSNLPISNDFIMYNSGAVGFTNSKINLLENNSPITIDNKVYHYWYFKDFRPIVSSFFKKYSHNSVKEFINKMDSINPEVLSVPILEYKAMNFWQKTIQKIKLGKKWQIPGYDL